MRAASGTAGDYEHWPRVAISLALGCTPSATRPSAKRIGQFRPFGVDKARRGGLPIVNPIGLKTEAESNRPIARSERRIKLTSDNFSSRNEKLADTYFAFMTQVHNSSGIPMPPLSYSSQELARNSRAHTKFFSFWYGHEGSFSKGQWEPIFSADVHLTAFDGRRRNAAQSSWHLVLNW